MKNGLKEIGFAAFLLLLAVLLVLSLFWALSIGTVKLPLEEIYAAVLDQFTSGQPIEATGQGPVHDIVWLLRLPRLILAALVGAGLASCGVIMQAIVKNPLADPYILGISSGASLGATSAILLGIAPHWVRTLWGSLLSSALLRSPLRCCSFRTWAVGRTR